MKESARKQIIKDGGRKERKKRMECKERRQKKTMVIKRGKESIRTAIRKRELNDRKMRGKVNIGRKENGGRRERMIKNVIRKRRIEVGKEEKRGKQETKNRE